MNPALKPKPRRVLTDGERQEIRRIYAEGKTSQHTLARQFGTSQHTVFVILKEGAAPCLTD